MRLLGIAATLCAVIIAQPTHASQVAITLDDLPYVMPPRGDPEEGLSIVQGVLRVLEEYGITATGFVVGKAINEESRPALRAFAEAGHTVGNHSWSHPNYGDLSVEEFRKETQRANDAIGEWLGTEKYYRFPYLSEGETPEAKKAAAEVLSDLGYRDVPVSIDNDDWRFNSEYMDALEAGDKEAVQEIAARYLDHMKERTRHFQDLARKVLGRDVKHILLLHMNEINADHLDDLLAWYQSEGWEFVTVEEALADPLYSAPDIYNGPRGISQIERVMGKPSK